MYLRFPPAQEQIDLARSYHTSGTVPKWIVDLIENSLANYKEKHPDFELKNNTAETYSGLLYVEFLTMKLRISKNLDRARRQLDEIFFDCYHQTSTLQPYGNELDFVKLLFKDFYDSIEPSNFGI